MLARSRVQILGRVHNATDAQTVPRGTTWPESISQLSKPLFPLHHILRLRCANVLRASDQTLLYALGHLLNPRTRLYPYAQATLSQKCRAPHKVVLAEWSARLRTLDS